MNEYIENKRKIYPRFTEFMRFIISGGVATLIDIAVMFFVMYLPYRGNYASIFQAISTPVSPAWLTVIATGIGFLVGLAFNYFFSIYYVYGKETRKMKTTKEITWFTILSTIGLLIQTLGMFVFNGLIGINQWVVKAILIVVVLIFNYITRKKLIFNNQVKEEVIEKIESPKLTKKSIILNVILIISAVCFSMLFCTCKIIDWKAWLTSFLIVVAFTLFLFCYEKNFFDKINLKNRAVLTLTILFSLFFISVGFNTNPYFEMYPKIFVCFGASFAAFVYSYLISVTIVKLATKFIKSLTKGERKFLIIFVISLAAITVLLFGLTYIFVDITIENDRILSLDTSWFSRSFFNAWHAENDIRHYLMTLATIPLFIGNYFFELLFPLTFDLKILMRLQVQIVLCAVSIVLVWRIFKKSNIKASCLFAILFGLTFSIFFNVLSFEKFIVSMFYIILTLYFAVENNDFKWLTFILSVCLLTTNVFLLPIVLLYNKTSAKKFYTEVFSIAILFIVVMLVVGKFERLFVIQKDLKILKAFSTIKIKISYEQKFLQTLIFISSIFLFPKYYVNDGLQIWQTGATFNVFAVIGLIILVLCVISFILNRKNKLAIASFYWIMFMLVLLVGAGWGSLSNEMFIYSTIFIVPIYSLLAMFFEKVFKGKVLKIVVISLFVAASIYNIIMFAQFLKFACINFPGLILNRFI